MVLVDTSVWIDYLRGTPTAANEAVDTVLSAGQPFAITGVIYQEVLQGADSPETFARLAEYFGTQRFCHPADPIRTYAGAADLYGRCRRAGITIRSTIHCLIAQLAIEHELLLLHNDRDYLHIKQVAPELRFYGSPQPE